MERNRKEVLMILGKIKEELKWSKKMHWFVVKKQLMNDTTRSGLFHLQKGDRISSELSIFGFQSFQLFKQVDGSICLWCSNLTLQIPVFLDHFIHGGICGTLSLRSSDCGQLIFKVSNVLDKVIVFSDLAIEFRSDIIVFLVCKGIFKTIMVSCLWACKSRRSPLKLTCDNLISEKIFLNLIFSFVSILIDVLLRWIVCCQCPKNLVVHMLDLGNSLLIHFLFVWHDEYALIDASLGLR